MDGRNSVIKKIALGAGISIREATDALRGFEGCVYKEPLEAPYNTHAWRGGKRKKGGKTGYRRT